MPGAEIAFFVLPMSTRHADPKDGCKKVYDRLSSNRSRPPRPDAGHSSARKWANLFDGGSAETWCMDVMMDHYDRRLGMSDARIEPFKGMVACFEGDELAERKSYSKIAKRK